MAQIAALHVPCVKSSILGHRPATRLLPGLPEPIAHPYQSACQQTCCDRCAALLPCHKAWLRSSSAAASGCAPLTGSNICAKLNKVPSNNTSAGMSVLGTSGKALCYLGSLPASDMPSHGGECWLSAPADMQLHSSECCTGAMDGDVHYCSLWTVELLPSCLIGNHACLNATTGSPVKPFQFSPQSGLADNAIHSCAAKRLTENACSPVSCAWQAQRNSLVIGEEHV